MHERKRDTSVLLATQQPPLSRRHYIQGRTRKVSSMVTYAARQEINREESCPLYIKCVCPYDVDMSKSTREKIQTQYRARRRHIRR